MNAETRRARAFSEPRFTRTRARTRRDRLLRPARFDDLGLRRVLSDRMLPLLVAAMAFLALLALAGAAGASTLVRHWQDGAATTLTIQVPNPGEADPSGHTRLDRVFAVLRATGGVEELHVLTDTELSDLLRPWLGQATDRMAIPLPTVISASRGSALDLAALSDAIAAAAPGSFVDSHAPWVERLAVLARSLQACAWAIVAVVIGVAVCVVAIAVRNGLLARRDAIEIVHGLGAPDGYIAGRFARRITGLVAGGAFLGTLVGLPVVLALARLAAPFADATSAPVPAGWDAVAALPSALLLAAPAVPVIAALIGFATTQVTVRRWLSRLA